jgi:hypothetical protein
MQSSLPPEATSDTKPLGTVDRVVEVPAKPGTHLVPADLRQHSIAWRTACLNGECSPECKKST